MLSEIVVNMMLRVEWNCQFPLQVVGTLFTTIYLRFEVWNMPFVPWIGSTNDPWKHNKHKRRIPHNGYKWVYIFLGDGFIPQTWVFYKLGISWPIITITLLNSQIMYLWIKIILGTILNNLISGVLWVILFEDTNNIFFLEVKLGGLMLV
jgi:hypothetical protein